MTLERDMYLYFKKVFNNIGVLTDMVMNGANDQLKV